MTCHNPLTSACTPTVAEHLITRLFCEGFPAAVLIVTEELPHLFAAADVVLSRAGSNSLCELQALKKPMLLIPYPMGAARGDQIVNAESYRKRGLALVLNQDQMNKDTLVQAIHELFE